MAGPNNEVAAGADGHGLRASHAEREQVVDVLKAAFVQGRLDRDEFELRVGQALASRTCVELAALTVDLPARLAGARRPEPLRESVSKKAVTAVACVSVALAGMLAAPGLSLAVVMVVLLFAVPTGWLLLFHDWLDKRAGRQSAQGPPPGAGGEPSQRRAPADPTGQFLPIDRGQQRWLLALKRQVAYRRKYSHGGTHSLAWATADTMR